MANLLEEERCGGQDMILEAPVWHRHDSRTYQCRVLIVPDAAGGYSAFATRLPGVVSEGETVDEVIENIRDAFQAALQEYLSSSQSIPWQNETFERTADSMERWILVNV